MMSVTQKVTLRKERTGMSKWMQLERSMMNILPCERQNLLCVRSKQTGWHALNRSFR